MAEEQATGEAHASNPGGVDGFFSKVSAYIGQKVSAFVAFLYLILAVGIIIGYFVTVRAPDYIFPAILAPVVLGLIAYYNRAIAIVLFFVAFAFIIFLA